MPTSYTYPLSATASGNVLPAKLAGEIAPFVTVALSTDPVVGGGNVQLTFVSDVPADSDNKGMLDSIIAKHDHRTTGLARMHLGSLLQAGELTIGTDWTDIGGVVTTVGFYPGNHRMKVGRVIGEYQCDGAGVEFRIVKEGDFSLCSSPHAPASTSGAWAKLGFMTDLPLEIATHTFRVQARKNSVTNLKVRYVSVSLLELY